MVLREALIENNILSQDEISELKCKLNKKNSSIDVDVMVINSLNLNRFLALDDYIYDFLEPLNIDRNINISYQNINLNNDEVKEYLDYFLGIINNPRLNSLNLDDAKINDDYSISFDVPFDLRGISDLIDELNDLISFYNLPYHCTLFYDNELSIENAIKEADERILNEYEKLKNEAKEIEEVNKKLKAENNKKIAPKKVDAMPISEIPLTYSALSEFIFNRGNDDRVLVKGYIFDEVTGREFANGKSFALINFKITDDTDSISVNKWCRSEEEYKLLKGELKEGKLLEVSGKVGMDNYSHAIMVTANKIEIIGEMKKDYGTDLAEEKRVELHVHSKLTALDGINDISEYVDCALSYGMKGIGLTDLNGIYAFPDLENAIKKKKLTDFKPIYGAELCYIDDTNYKITSDIRDIDLKSATYCVYDLETTGLSLEHDRIIEIAAFKVKEGIIVDKFNTFVNPKRPIPEYIVAKTTITDFDVKDAPTIEEILPKFLEFAKDSILVAHNSQFDVGMTYANIKRLNIDYPVLPSIDTLALFKASYSNEVKTFNLKSLCKYFKVKQEQHHRADDDTRVLTQCFILMLNDLYQKEIFNYKDINSLIDKNDYYKHVITKESHINFLCINNTGKRNLYKIISDALTTHLSKGEARALKTVIDDKREGLLVGSSAVLGEVFNLALYRTIDELKEHIKYYDYIEVAPPSSYYHLFEFFSDPYKTICDTISKIIEVAKEENKIVVAVSDCYYLTKNDKKFREIMVATPRIGGGEHYLSKVKKQPDAHFRSTSEMLSEFDFLDKDLAYEIVVKNTNKIMNMIETFPIFSSEKFAPRDDQFKDNPVVGFIPSINEESKRIVMETINKTYGDNPHPIILKRAEKELNSIISSGYMSVYYISHLLVKKSLEEGYIVGSRGSVGSSFVATMMNITEVNPLKPHYICKKCKYHILKMTDDEIAEYPLKDFEIPIQTELRKINSGYDLPDMNCPCCGNKLSKNGQDIPFETFLGFKGDKTPDIDLNFSGEYQAKAHEYIREVFGNDHAFRAGTVSTIANKVGYGYVKKYCEDKGVILRDCEISRISSHLDGIKRSTGQHPGGIVVIPNYAEVFDATPYQYPADDTSSSWRTTHFDYHKYEENLLKFDILGHDDPTMIKYLMDYVTSHKEEYPFDNVNDIPIDDKNLYKLFNSTDIIGVSKEALGAPVATYGIPEFGTRFVQKMLLDTKPETFAQLIKISGLSHGTDVWANNAQDLISGSTEFGEIKFRDIIGCRDDIMVDLMDFGLNSKDAFDIMEFVRKGKLHGGKVADWNQFVEKMDEKNVPKWYIFSCSKIKYMFPKAHAIAYVIMALRIAWFKVYSPLLFYSAWLSKRAKGFSVNAFLGGPNAIRAKLEEINAKENKTATDDDLINTLNIALEMTLRGIKFLPVDINKSSAEIFEIEDGKLRIPFVAVDSLGLSVANNIINARNEKEFTSIKDAIKRTKLNDTLSNYFKENHFFGDLDLEDEAEAEGIFAFI